MDKPNVSAAERSSSPSPASGAGPGKPQRLGWASASGTSSRPRRTSPPRASTHDLGVGSAMANTSQQVGGAAQAAAQLASYHAAYLTSVAVLTVLAGTTAFLLRPERRPSARTHP